MALPQETVNSLLVGFGAICTLLLMLLTYYVYTFYCLVQYDGMSSGSLRFESRPTGTLSVGGRDSFLGGYDSPSFWGPTGGQALSKYNQKNVYAGDDDGNSAHQQVLANQAAAAKAKAKGQSEGMLSEDRLSAALKGAM